MYYAGIFFVIMARSSAGDEEKEGGEQLQNLASEAVAGFDGCPQIVELPCNSPAPAPASEKVSRLLFLS